MQQQQHPTRRERLVVTRLGILLMVLILVLLIAPSAWASITTPPSNDIFFQTTGEQAPIGIGDYYTNLAGDNVHHLAVINIPCVSNQTFRVELFDPEMYDAGAPGVGTETVDDEIRPDPPGAPVPDQTSYVFYRPSGAPVGGTTVFGPYPAAPAPPPATHNNWIAYQTVTLGPAPVDGVDCGNYSIETWTGNESGVVNVNDDDNAWKYRLMGGPGTVGTETFDPAVGPDGILGTGDEAWLGVHRLSYQHNTGATQSFYWFVDDDGDPSWTGRNFDIDIYVNAGQPGLCGGIGDPACDITYVAPTLGNFPASLSSNSFWNPGQPARGAGDLHATAGVDTEPGVWQADVTIPVDNQYIIEIENGGKPIFLDPPIVPDVVVDKDDFVTTVGSPGTTTYTIRIENVGGGAAMALPGPDPEIVDTFNPAEMTFVSCQINPPLIGTCAQVAAGVIHFQLGAQTNALNFPSGVPFGPIPGFLPSPASGLQAFGTVQVTLNINSGLPVGTAIRNVATVDWSDIYDNNFAPVSDDDINNVVNSPIADLALTKDGTIGPVTVGAMINYQVVVTNNGPDDVTGAHVTDNFPPEITNITWTCVASAGSSCTAGPVSGSINDTVNILNGGTLTYDITARVIAAGTFTNVASVTHPGVDPDPTNNSDDHTITANPASSDLTLVKDGTVGPVNVGDPITYTITINNLGPDDVFGATITDSFPPEITSITWTCAAAGGAVCGAAAGAGNINTVLDIPVGGTVTFNVSATVFSAGAGSFTNVATVNNPNTDPTPANNTDDHTIPITMPTSDLVVTKTGSAGPVNLGDPVNYTVVVTNNGPDDVMGVTITDNFPPALGGITWTCTEAGGAVCGSATGSGGIHMTVDMPVGSSLTFNVTATVVNGGALDNVASVTHPNADPNAGNNSDTHSIVNNAPVVAPPPGGGGGGGGGGGPVIVRIDPVITKLGSPDAALLGERVTWRVIVSNPGASPINGVVVTDSIPGSFDIISVTTTQGTVTVNGNNVTANIGTLQPGQTVTITIETITNASAVAGEICNIAFVGDLFAEDCITLFPGELPETGSRPIALWSESAPLLVGLALGTALIGVVVGWVVLKRRQRP